MAANVCGPAFGYLKAGVALNVSNVANTPYYWLVYRSRNHASVCQVEKLLEKALLRERIPIRYNARRDYQVSDRL